MALNEDDWNSPIPPAGRDAAIAVPSGDMNLEDAEETERLRAWYPERAEPAAQPSAPTAPMGGGGGAALDVGGHTDSGWSEFTKSLKEEPEEEGSDWWGNVKEVAKGTAATAVDLGAGAIRAGGAAAGAIAHDSYNLFTNRTLHEPQSVKDDQWGQGWREKAEEIAGKVEDWTAETLDYTPVTSWDEVKDIWNDPESSVPASLMTTAQFGIETGTVSLPHMAAMMASMPAYFTARVGQLASARAEADGRDAPSDGDYAASAAFAALVVAADKIGLDKIIASVGKGAAKGTTGAAIGEGVTELIQEGFEYANEIAGTKKEFDVDEAFDRMAAGAVGGAVAGGGLSAGGRLGKFAHKVAVSDKTDTDTGGRMDSSQESALKVDQEPAADLSVAPEPTPEPTPAPAEGIAEAPAPGRQFQSIGDIMKEHGSGPQVQGQLGLKSVDEVMETARVQGELRQRSETPGQQMELRQRSETPGQQMELPGTEVAGPQPQEAIPSERGADWSDDIRRQLQPEQGEMFQPEQAELPIQFDTTPEPVEDLIAQVDHMFSGSGKQAVFVAESNGGDMEAVMAHAQEALGKSGTSGQLHTATSPNFPGTLITTNKEAAADWESDPSEEKLAGILGYAQSKTELQNPDTAVAVQKLDGDGRVVWEQVVDEGREQEAMEAMGGKGQAIRDTVSTDNPWEKKYKSFDDFDFRVIPPDEAQARRDATRKGGDFDTATPQPFTTRGGEEALSTVAPTTIGKTAPATVVPEAKQRELDLEPPKEKPKHKYTPKPKSKYKYKPAIVPAAKPTPADDRVAADLAGRIDSLKLKPREDPASLREELLTELDNSPLDLFKHQYALSSIDATDAPALNKAIVDLKSDLTKLSQKTGKSRPAKEGEAEASEVGKAESAAAANVKRLRKAITAITTPAGRNLGAKLKTGKVPREYSRLAALPWDTVDLLTDIVDDYHTGEISAVEAQQRADEALGTHVEGDRTPTTETIVGIPSKAAKAKAVSKTREIARKEAPPADSPLTQKMRKWEQETVALETAIEQNLRDQEVIQAELDDPSIVHKENDESATRPRVSSETDSARAEARASRNEDTVKQSLGNIAARREHVKEARKRAKEKGDPFDVAKYEAEVKAARELYLEEKATQEDVYYGLDADEIFARNEELDRLKEEGVRLQTALDEGGDLVETRTSPEDKGWLKERAERTRLIMGSLREQRGDVYGAAYGAAKKDQAEKYEQPETNADLTAEEEAISKEKIIERRAKDAAKRAVAKMEAEIAEVARKFLNNKSSLPRKIRKILEAIDPKSRVKRKKDWKTQKATNEQISLAVAIVRGELEATPMTAGKLVAEFDQRRDKDKSELGQNPVLALRVGRALSGELTWEAYLNDILGETTLEEGVAPTYDADGNEITPLSGGGVTMTEYEKTQQAKGLKEHSKETAKAFQPVGKPAPAPMTDAEILLATREKLKAVVKQIEPLRKKLEKAKLPKQKKELKATLTGLEAESKAIRTYLKQLEAKLDASQPEAPQAEPEEAPAPEAAKPVRTGRVQSHGGNRRGSKPWGATGPRVISEPAGKPTTKLRAADYNSVPYDYQIEGAEYALDSIAKGEKFMLADGPGTGKTMQMLMVADQVAKDGGKVLIVHTDNYDSNFRNDAKLLGIDADAFTNKTWDAFRDSPPAEYDLVILDEAHRIKSDGTKTYAALRAVKTKATMLVTATPTDSWQGLGVYAYMEGVTDKEFVAPFGITLKQKKQGTEVSFKAGVSEHDAIVGLAKRMTALDASGRRVARSHDRKAELNAVEVGSDRLYRGELEADITDIDRDIVASIDQNNAFDVRSALAKSKVLSDYALSGEAATLALESLANGDLPIVMAERRNTSLVPFRGANLSVPSPLDSVKKQLLKDNPKLRIATLSGAGITKKRLATLLKDIAADKYDVVITTTQKGGVGIDLDTKTKANKKRHLIMIGNSYSSIDTVQAYGRVDRVSTAIKAKITVLSSKLYAGVRAKAINLTKRNFSEHLANPDAFPSPLPYERFVIETVRDNGDVGVTFASFNKGKGAVGVVQGELDAIAGRGGAARRYGTEWIIPAENMDSFREAMSSYLRDNTKRAMVSPDGSPVVHSPASDAARKALSTNLPTSTGDMLRAVQATLEPSDPRSRVIKRLLAMGANAPVQALGEIDPSGFSYEVANSTVDGYYNTRTGEVFVNPNAADVAHTTLHESAHAALDARLESDSKFRAQIEGIKAEFEATGESVDHSLAAVDVHEFLAESLSSPPLQKALQQKTLWQRFVAAARRALRIAPGPDTTALGRILEAIDSAPEFDGPAPGDGPNRAMVSGKDVAKEAKGFVKETWQAARRGMLGVLTREQIADVHGDLLTRLSGVLPDVAGAADNTKAGKNPLLDYNRAVNLKDAEVTRQHNAGYKYQRAVAELEKNNPREYEKMGALAIDSTRYEIWPNRDFDDPGGKNHHLKYTTTKDKKTGEYKKHSLAMITARKLHHMRVQKSYNAMEPETKKIYDDTAKFFEEEWSEDARAITANILEIFDVAKRALDEEGNYIGERTTPVMQQSKSALAEEFLEGTKRDGLEGYVVMTKDADGREAIDVKTTHALHTHILEMRRRAKVRGPYFPLKRDGNYMVEGKGKEHKMAVTFASVDSPELLAKAQKKIRGHDVYVDPANEKDHNKELIAKEHQRLVRKAANKKFYAARDLLRENNRDLKFESAEFSDTGMTGSYYEYALEFHRSESLAEEARQGFVESGMTAPDVRLKHKPANLRGISGDLKARIEAKLGGDNSQLMNTLNAAMLEMLPETSIHKATLKRMNVKGASSDLTWAVAAHINGHGYYRGKLKYGARIDRAQRNMRVIADSPMEGETQRTKFKVAEIANEIKTREDADLSVERDSLTARAAQAATSVGFIQYLLSTSYSMVNATQPTLLALPWLAAQQHRVKGANGSASEALGAAYSALSPTILKRMAKVGGGFGFLRLKAVDASAFDFLTPGESTIGAGIQKSIRESGLKDPEGVIKMLNELGENGKITMTFAADMKGEANKTRYEGGMARGVQELGGAAMDWARIMPHLTEILNRSVTATAAYELATGSMGYTHQQAVDFAGEAVDKTQFNYSPSNKARLMSRAGPLGEATKVVTQFMQHPQHVYFLMTRNTYLSFSSIKKLMTDKNMTAAEREQAMADVRTASRTVGYVTATHMLAAGVIGGTFEPILMAASMAYQALMATFGEDEEDVEPFELFMRNSLYDGLKATGMHDDTVHMITTMFEKGLPAALGVDISGRVGLRNLFTSGMDNNKEGKEAFQAGLINLLGPTASTVGNFFEAAKFARSGENLRAAEKVLPKMFRDAVKTYRFNTEGVTDIYGNEMREEFSATESVVNALGFQPTAMTDLYDKRNAIKSKEFRITKRRDQFIKDFKRASGPDERAQIMEEIRQFNKMVPKWARISYGDTLKASIKDTRKRSAMGRKEGLYLPRKRQGLLEEGRSY